MCSGDNERRCGDSDNTLLGKILGRLKEIANLFSTGGSDTVTLTVSDIEIGAVEIKDGDTDTRAKIITTCPDPADRGLVVRNIPCGTQAISAVSLPLPDGAATEARLIAIQNSIEDPDLGIPSRLSESLFSSRTNTLGQKNMAGSMPVVIAADQSPIPFTMVGAAFIGVCPGEFDQGLVVRNIPCGTQAISAISLPLPTGAATEATLNSVAVLTTNIDSFISTYFPAFEAQLAYLANLDVQLSTLVRTTCPSGADAALAVRNIPCGTQPISAASLPLPTGASTEQAVQDSNLILNSLYILLDDWIFFRTNTLGQKNMAGSMPVVIASDQSAVPVSGTVSTKTSLTASSPTFATVGVTSAQALASNVNRKGLILVNTSSNRISIGIGSAAVLDSGITLYPGDSFGMDEYCFSTAAINAIAFGASSNLSIQEFTT